MRGRTFCIFLMAAGPLCGQLATLEVAPQAVTLARQPDDKGRQVWHTARFRIDLDLDLAAEDLKRMAQVMETTAQVVKLQKLPIYAPPAGRPRVAIFARDADYAAAGAPAGTAGYYDWRRACVAIRGTSLVHVAERPSRLTPRNDEDLVVHELVHLCMHGVNSRMPQWFDEGMAEYLSCGHLGGGRFSFANIDAAIREHLRVRMNPQNPEILLVPLAGIASLDSQGWSAYVESLAPNDRYRAYASALLLTHYYLHGGPERTEWLHKALRPEPPETFRRRKLPSIETAGVEEVIERYWKPKGITPKFGNHKNPAADAAGVP
jgi:hypothetical protein